MMIQKLDSTNIVQLNEVEDWGRDMQTLSVGLMILRSRAQS